MKKYLLILSILFSSAARAQVLNVNEIIQEQNQWCWSGVSKCILDYYGYPQQQCDIAEYARSVITWYNFGTVNCCVDPTQGCNYWNYLYGSAGSIDDIVDHFGVISSYGFYGTLSLPQIVTESNSNRPFVVRWGWNSGGGHFVLGHGVNGNDIYYMNPWFGEGLHISDYSWLVNDGVHTWTHTLSLTSSPTGLNDVPSPAHIGMFPNPSSGEVTLNMTAFKNAVELVMYNSTGQKVYSRDLKNAEQVKIKTSDFSSGIYRVKVNSKEGVIANQDLVIL